MTEPGSGTADASLVLFALTLLVTPANIYMLTHGAKLPPVAMEPVPVAGVLFDSITLLCHFV